jgi:hypothetical protein
MTELTYSERMAYIDGWVECKEGKPIDYNPYARVSSNFGPNDNGYDLADLWEDGYDDCLAHMENVK